jgi:hypothetical protein
VRRALVIAVTVLVLLGPDAGTAGAQENPKPEAPTQDIVPRPNSGEAPKEAGDRGGALQLLNVGLIVVALGGADLHLVRQSQRARSQAP